MELLTTLLTIAPLITVSLTADLHATKVKRTVYTNTTHQRPIATIPITQNNGLLYGDFVVGNGSHFDLIIDTNCSHVYLNAGPGERVYNPSSEFYSWGTKSRLGQPMFLGNDFTVSQMEYNISIDTMTAGGLVAHNQSFGIADNPMNNNTVNITQFPYDGLVGLAPGNPYSREIYLNTSFYQTLALQGQLQSYEFGLALCKNGTGSLILGGVDMCMMQDIPASQGILPGYDAWVVAGAITVGSSPPITSENQKLFITSSTQYVVGSIDAVQQMFRVTFANATTSSYDINGFGKIVNGIYLCSQTQPYVGITLGAGKIATRPMWNIDPSAFLKPAPDGRCTVDIIGWDGIEDGTWYLGQAWLKGKYVAFTNDNRVSVAHLKE